LKKHDYTIFTKQELTNFLQKYESNFMYIDSPYDIILSIQMDNVSKLLDENLKYGKQLNEEYERTKDGLTYLVASKKNNDEWQKLDKEYDRLSKLRFGE
jgi:hypothetical protein